MSDEICPPSTLRPFKVDDKIEVDNHDHSIIGVQCIKKY